MTKSTTKSKSYAHLLGAPREALEAMTRGEVLGQKPSGHTEDEARQKAREIIAAAKRTGHA
ncbi:hypothetical protein [Paraburkholderia sp. BR10954]|uniref:hypothetical protein n=1 Tax=Paraburkholderia sp. BR10954 TaxID=3236995 RepID=UPI0034D18FB3